MSAKIRLEGLYDKRTIDLAYELGGVDLSFDFRPRSLNFIQQYLFLDILDSKRESINHFSLRYEDEPDFMVKDTLDKLSSTYFGPFHLEFSGNQNRSYYDSFEKPFIWHYREDAQDLSVYQSEFLKGIVLPFSLLREKHEKGQFTNFVHNFYRLAHQCLLKNEGKLIVSLNWGDNIFPSLFEYFDIDQISLPIDTNVEACFRNVDKSKLQVAISGLGPFTKSF